MDKMCAMWVMRVVLYPTSMTIEGLVLLVDVI
jgi:hypothetical protein